MKLEQIVEMGKPAQICDKCGKGPIHKTHNWIKGGGWKCRKDKPMTDTSVDLLSADPVVPGQRRRNVNGDAVTVGLSVPAWKAMDTNNFQGRDGQYPKPGVPDTIDVFPKGALFTFNNTKPSAAERWVTQFAQSKKLPFTKVTAQQGEDNWVDVWVE